MLRLLFVTLTMGLVARLSAQIADDPVTVPVQFQGLYSADATGDTENPATVSITPNGTNYAAGTSGGGSGQLTSNGVARLRPGRTYLFTINSYYLTRLQVKVTAPAGYRVFINTVEHEMFDWQMGDPAQHLDAVGAFSVRLDDGSGAPVGQAASLRPGRVLWSVGLGNLRNGKPAGSIVMAEDGLTANTYTPSALYYDRDSGSANGKGDDGEVIIIKAGGILRQVYAQSALVDIVANGDHASYLRFYPRDTGQISGPDASGIYTVSGTPIYEYLVENPTYPALDALRITKTTNQNGQLVTWTEMRKQSGQPTGQTQWLVQDWADSSVSTSPVQQRWTYTDSDRSELLEVLESNGTTVVHKDLKLYSDLNFGTETSRELTSETVGDGTTAVTTTYTYNTDTNALGDWHRVKNISSTDGSWTAFTYCNEFTMRGQIREVRRPHKNSPASDPGFAQPSGERTYYTYDYQDNFGTNKLPTRIETSIDNTVVSRTEIDYSSETITDQSADYSSGFSADLPLTVASRRDFFDDTHYLTTVSKVYREDADDQYRFFPGLPYSVQRPDKTMSVNLYSHAAFVGTTYSPLIAGEGRKTLTVNGTSDTSIGVAPSYSLTQPVPTNFRVVAGKSSSSAIFYGGQGVVTIAEQSAYASNSQWIATQQDWPTYTDSFYPSQVAHRASYSGGTWLVANNTWTQGRLAAAVGATGISQTFSYDKVGRPETITRDSATALNTTIAALTTTNGYDAAGRLTSQTVSSPGYSDSLASSKTYDLAGRVLTETTPGGGTTSYSYDVANRTVTVTLPTGSTRVETMYLDGRSASVAGSAVVAENYDYLIDSGGLRHNKVSLPASTGGRRKEVWVDWLGRTTRALKPGFTGQPDFEEDQFYDATKGQLQKTTHPNTAISNILLADTYYEYSSMGEATRSGLDVSGGGLQLGSMDRVADADTTVEFYSGDYWLTSRTWSYPWSDSTNASTPKLMGTVRKRLTGLSDSLRAETRSLDAEGNETVQTVTVNSASKLVTMTTTRPGLASPQTDVALNGLPISTTGHDGLIYTREYDALTRPRISTDPRTGTITTSYYAGTALPQQTTDGAGKQLSFTQYDTAGRPIVSYDGTNKTTRITYNALGQVEYQWGSASYPVSYVYDALGQRTKQRTYQSGDSSTWESTGWPGGGASYSETTWEFDDPSGLLTKKYDATGNFVEYTYNNRGQTSERFWSRTVNGQRMKATYGYDGTTGELTSIGYNDSTPGVGYSYNRLGQTASATDHTGTRTFGYDPSSPWRLTSETLPGFYGGRVLSRSYDGATSTNTGDSTYSGHTIGTVLGSYRGYSLGTSGTPASDLELNYATSNIGRLAGQVSKRNNGATSRQFVYGYETNSALLKTLSVVSNAFYVERSFEPNRNLLTRIESRWGATVRTKFEYAYDDRRQRQSMVQSGDAFADYGNSIHQVFNYNSRGELTSAGTYLGASPTDTSSLLKARLHEFDYDSIGNRKTSNTSGVSAVADHYTLNSLNLNQYGSRENNTLPVGGTADASAKVVAVGNTLTLAGRAGRHWGDNLVVNNSSQPFYGPLPIYSALIGGGAGGKDLIRTDSKIAFLAKALQSFTYDTDGNMTSDGVWDYQWDAENRLVHMETTSIASGAGMPYRKMDFRYDYQSRRVLKQVRDGSNVLLTERRYLYDGSNLIAEFDGTAAIKRSYTWGLDLAGSLSATGGVGALTQIYDHDLGKTFFPTYDGNGNIAALINADTSAAEAIYEYSPFGELLRCEGSYAKENPFRFSTKFTDDESGLVYYGARYYAPGLGRFVNRDPIAEAGGLNLYGFCGNDGVNHWDYLGQSWLSKALKKFWKPLVAIAAGVLTAGVALYAYSALTATAGMAMSFGSALTTALTGSVTGFTSLGAAVSAGAGFGFGSAFTGTALNGGSLGQSFKAGLTGAVIGGVAAGLTYGVNQVAPDWFKYKNIPGNNQSWFTAERVVDQVERIAMRGTIGGLASEASGGKFSTGFELTAAFDTVKWATDLWGEARYRWESNNIPGRKFQIEKLRQFGNSWETADGNPVEKVQNEAFPDPRIPNVGVAINQTTNKFIREDGWLGTLAQKVPGFNNLGYLHDLWASPLTVLGHRFMANLSNSLTSQTMIAPFLVGDYALLSGETAINYGRLPPH